jgi:ubiquinone biosynthesis protein UbiJ
VSFSLLQNTMLLPAELALNQLLVLDAATPARLSKLRGRTLAVHISQPTLTLYVSITGNGLHLSSIFEDQPDASVHGPLTGLLKLLAQGASTTNLYSSKVEIQGDTGFVQALQALLLDVDVDWEFQLGKFIGDIPTHVFSTGLKQSSDFIRSTGFRIKQNLQDYLAQETSFFPKAHELENFYAAVTELTLRVDRLRAKVENYKNRENN